MSCGAIKYNFMRADVHFNLSISISKKYPKFSDLQEKRITMNEPLLFEVHTCRDISAKTHESLDIYQDF